MGLKKIGPERIGAFSDGVIAIIITIMVLDLKAPHEATAAGYLALWPMFGAYALSYLFVGVVWVNHHHILRYVVTAEPPVIWTNLLFLFFVSLIPYFTECLAASHMNSLTTALYACVFVLVAVSHQIFQSAVVRQATTDEECRIVVRAATHRNTFSIVWQVAAVAAAFWSPWLSLGMILFVVILYAVPEAVGTKKRKARG